MSTHCAGKGTEALFISLPKTAAAIGVGVRVVRDAVEKGQIPARRIGKRLLVPKRALERLVEAGSLFVLLMFVLLAAIPALAQYSPIPDEPSTAGCPTDPTQCSGYKVRQDMNNRLSGAVPISPALAVQYVTTSMQIGPNAGVVHYDCDATAGPVTIDLPDAPLVPSGQLFSFKKVDNTSNACIISIYGGVDKIDGATTVTLASQYNWVVLISSSAFKWSVISETGSGGGGGGSPAGSTPQLQFNNGGSFGAVPSESGSGACGVLGYLNGVWQWYWNGIYDVKCYGGAVGDNTTDDWAAIQGGIFASNAAAGTNYYPQPPVYFPTTPGSCYAISKPLWVTSNEYGRYVDLVGAGSKYETCIRAMGNFPIFVVTQPNWGVNGSNSGNNPLGTITGSPLVGSTGASLVNAKNAEWGINVKSILSQNGAGSSPITGYTESAAAFSGLADYTVEMAFNLGSTSNGDTGNLLSSMGGNATSAPNAGSNPDEGLLTISYAVASGGSANTLRISTNLSGGVIDINPSACTFTSNATHYIAVSYNGSDVQTYLDGNRCDNVSATGTVRDTPANDLFYRLGIASWPAGLYDGTNPPLTTDAFRISNLARYTGSTMSVPSSKYSCDANTIFLMNGTQVLPSYTVNGTATQFPYISPECVGGSSTTADWTIPWFEIATIPVFATIEHLQLYSGTIGILMGNALDGRLNDLYFSAQGWTGLDWFNNCYQNVARDLRFNMASDAQAAAIVNWGGNLLEALNVPGAGFYGIVDGQGGNHYVDPFIQAGSNNLGGFALAKSGTIYSTTVIDHYIDDNEENATGPVLLINAANSILLNGGNGDQSGQSVSPIQIGKNTAGLNLDLSDFGLDFIGTTGPPPVIDFLSANIGGYGTRTVRWDNPRINGVNLFGNMPANGGAGFPISNSPAEVAVEPIVPVTLTGTSPMLTFYSGGDLGCETDNLVLSGNTTMATFGTSSSSTPLNGKCLRANICQPSSGGPYTFALSGSGATPVQVFGSCNSGTIPTIGTNAGDCLWLEMKYDTNPATARLDVTDCGTGGP